MIPRTGSRPVIFRERAGFQSNAQAGGARSTGNLRARGERWAGSDPLAQYHPPVGAPGFLLTPAAAALLRGGPGAVDAQLDTC